MKILLLSITILLLLLVLRYAIFFKYNQPLKSGDSFISEVTLLSEPQENFGKQMFYVQDIKVEAPFFPKLSYGDRLRVKGVIEEYSYIRVGSSQEVEQLVIKSPEITLLPQRNIFISQAAFLRGRVYENFKSVLPGNESALLFGIVFGGSSGFSTQMKDTFRNTGVLHVVAASGMNVSMVGAFLLSFLCLLMPRRKALFFSVVGIFYYALISGFEPSIVRASIMICLTFSAGILGRQNYAYFTLFLTAWIMMIFQPLVVFEVGFLLSFSSTIGIVAIKPLFDSLSLMKKTKAVTDDISTTISAQAASVPIMVGSFSAYSLLSVLVNALVLWTIPFLMILGGVASFCAIFIPFLSFIPLYVSLPFLLYFEQVVYKFGSVPLLHIEHISLVFWVGYYMVLGGVVFWGHSKKQKS